MYISGCGDALSLESTSDSGRLSLYVKISNPSDNGGTYECESGTKAHVSLKRRWK